MRCKNLFTLSAGFILEEGFPLADLEKIVKSMAEEAKKAGVYIVTGDTKVVEKGKGDAFTSTPRVLVLYLKAFTFPEQTANQAT